MKLTFRQRWRYFWREVFSANLDTDRMEYNKRRYGRGGRGCSCKEVNFEGNWESCFHHRHLDRKPPLPIFEDQAR